MSVAKVMEITAESPESFEHAIRTGLERASKTIDQIKSAWIKEQTVVCEGNRIQRFRVNMKVTFVLKE